MAATLFQARQLRRGRAVAEVDGRHPIMCLMDYRALHIASPTRRCILEQIGGFSEIHRLWEAEEINCRIAKTGRREAGSQEDTMYYWPIHRGSRCVGCDCPEGFARPVRTPGAVVRRRAPRSQPSPARELDARLDLMKRRCKTCPRTITGNGHGYLIDCADRDADRTRP